MMHQRIAFSNAQGRFVYIPFERRMTCKAIQETVAEFYGLHPFCLTSKDRSRRVVRPRQIAMTLTRELTKMSLQCIGQRFGGRDHTTVIHAIRTIEALKQESAALCNDISLIKDQLV